MKISFFRLCIALFCFSATFAGMVSAADPLSNPLQNPLPNPLQNSLGSVTAFSLPATDGSVVSSQWNGDAYFTVLCFLGTECPLAKLYGPRLQTMSEQFAERGVRFIGISSNVQDSLEEVRQYANDYGLSFPIVKDHDRTVALSAGATRTPEIVVVDRVGGVRYRGRIDDQYEPGIARAEATRHDLHDALEDLVEGRPIAEPKTTAVGCLIALPRRRPAISPGNEQSDASVTYCDQISRILQAHCVECHRSGEIGPFVLDDYDEVLGWADMSIEVIDQQRMPPWHATDDHAEIANARMMPESDKQLLREWVEAGMPYGEARDLPKPKTYVDGWQLPRQPDIVLPMSNVAFEIPADGTVEYQYYVVDPKFESERWVKSAEVIPGNRSVVHHAIAFIRPPDGSGINDFGLLSAYVPGQRRSPLPDGYAQRIPAGSRIVFQMHYTPTGKPESDITRIGIVFADDEDVTHEVITMGGIEQDFEIPPGSPSYAVSGHVGGFPHDGLLLSVMPHMHLRGKSYQFSVARKDSDQTLVEVPHYDFNWQHNYELHVPVPLADVDRLSFTATFDNSPDNPTNPDATEYVTWGDQTWQEMAVTFISVAVPRTQGPTHLLPKTSDDEPAGSSQREALIAKAKSFAVTYMERFDDNGDGYLIEEEMPRSVWLFACGDFDQDGDSRISREEVEIAAYVGFQK